MNLSPRATELVALYEQEYNCKASELIFQVAKHLDKVGDMFRERGRKEAQKGGEPYPAMFSR